MFASFGFYAMLGPSRDGNLILLWCLCIYYSPIIDIVLKFKTLNSVLLSGDNFLDIQ